MKLNIQNGTLLISEGDFFTPPLEEEYVEKIKNKYRGESKITNTGSKYLNIRDVDNGDINMTFLFYNSKLEWLSITLGGKYNYPEFEITEAEKLKVRELLLSIGGDKFYSWGSVRYNEDNKAGIVSVIIKYN